MASQEDLAAENVLKRAELARISRQLKSRLSRTNLKIKDKASSPIKKLSLQNGHTKLYEQDKAKTLSPTTRITHDIPTTPKSNTRTIAKKKSVESLDLNKTEDENDEYDYDNTSSRSNFKNKYKRRSSSSRRLPPSSPVMEEFAIPTNPPSTPPHQKIHINPDIYNTASTNKTSIQNFSSPAVHNSSQQYQRQLLSTPDHQKGSDEGADLLMFLATSPSPAQYKQPPSTPSRSINAKLNQSSSIQRLGTNTGSNNLQMNGATPGTPMRNLLKTPGFNMNDYVNIFTPSPGHITRTPEQFSKDVNGKLIKF